jgi:hypothetical protein
VRAVCVLLDVIVAEGFVCENRLGSFLVHVRKKLHSELDAALWSKCCFVRKCVPQQEPMTSGKMIKADVVRPRLGKISRQAFGNKY